MDTQPFWPCLLDNCGNGLANTRKSAKGREHDKAKHGDGGRTKPNRGARGNGRGEGGSGSGGRNDMLAQMRKRKIRAREIAVGVARDAKRAGNDDIVMHAADANDANDANDAVLEAASEGTLYDLVEMWQTQPATSGTTRFEVDREALECYIECHPSASPKTQTPSTTTTKEATATAESWNETMTRWENEESEEVTSEEQPESSNDHFAPHSAGNLTILACDVGADLHDCDHKGGCGGMRRPLYATNTADEAVRPEHRLDDGDAAGSEVAAIEYVATSDDDDDDDKNNNTMNNADDKAECEYNDRRGWLGRCITT